MEKKLTYKLRQFESAISNFEDSLLIEQGVFPEIVLDTIESGRIQKFEFSCELFWKVLKIFLYEIDGVDVNTPKGVVKSFFEAGYCDYDDYEQIIKMINDRNWLSHIYNNETAGEIKGRLKEYLSLMRKIGLLITKKVEK
ncbi:HI0074 family nucleotidyltransferase substrate-binding subunit [Candidatus Margulisiibacteriota bacterium]